MTAPKDSAAQAIDDARALLETFLSSGWDEMHVVSGGTEIFLAQPRGGSNPMRMAPPVAAATPLPAVATPVAGPQFEVKAPHVATLVSVLAVGTQVAAGQGIATVRVLDEESELTASAAGTIVAVAAAPGDLLDYAAPVASIVEAA